MTASPNNSQFRQAAFGVAAVCLIALAIHLVVPYRQKIELDEFEHLHAAWLVSLGQTPYVDFFEHHTPLFYFLGAAILPLENSRFDTILQARLLALAFSLLMAVSAWLWMRRYGQLHALIAACLLGSTVFLLKNGSTVFLDTFSAPLLVISAFFIATGEKSPLRMAASGLAFGLAILFNLKASMALFAPAALLLSRVVWSSSYARRIWLQGAIAYSLGGIAAILFLAVLLGPTGLEGLWRSVVEMNLAWKARRSGLREVAELAWGDPFVCAAALAGLLHRLRDLIRRRFLLKEQDIPALFLASLAVGFFLMPVVWREYFVLVVPFILLVAAQALAGWFEAGFEDRRLATVSLCVLLFFGALALFPYRAIFRADRLAYVQSAVMLAGFACLSLAVRASGSQWWLQRSLCLALIGVVPLVRVGTELHRLDNHPQRAQVEYILANTSATDAIFDGYSGLGLFRPHAYRYWFLHEEVQAMLPEQEKTSGIIEALEFKRPPLAIVDRWVKSLPPKVQTYLRDHYEDTALPLLKKRNPATH